MLKKNFFLLIIFFALISQAVSQDEIFIKLKVNDSIITNIDIKKEISYLEILNPNISQLDNEKILNLAKKSIVKETIKNFEINKFFVLDDKDFIDEKLLENLINKLNLSQKEFENILIEKKSYTLEEVKRKLKIDILWNDLIFYKFNKQVKINLDELNKKIDQINSTEKKEYLLSEIIFEKKQDQPLNDYVDKIKESIKEIGFENTANIYSSAESSKFGGKIGWVDENNLSKIIIENLNNLKAGQVTEVIQIGNNYLILMINEIRIDSIKVDKEEELQKITNFETNKQLNQFSKIYYNKVSNNYLIDEK